MTGRNETYVRASVYLVRLPLFYTFYITLPILMITSMVISVFHQPNMGGEKITLSISVLLALTFFLGLVSSMTPKSASAIPLISKYLIFSMVLVTLSVVASVCVANLHHRTPTIHAMPRWLQKTFLETIPTVLLMQRPKVPHPIFPTGHRFSVSSEYPSNYKFSCVLFIFVNAQF